MAILSGYNSLTGLRLTSCHLKLNARLLIQVLSLLNSLKLQFFLVLCKFLSFLLLFQIIHILFNRLFVSNFTFVYYFLITSFFSNLQRNFLNFLFVIKLTMLISKIINYLIFLDETFLSFLIYSDEISVVLSLYFIFNG